MSEGTYRHKSQRKDHEQPWKQLKVDSGRVAISQIRTNWSVGWALKFAYRTLTFPLWAHQSYVPLAKRLYLNPTGKSLPLRISDLMNAAIVRLCQFQIRLKTFNKIYGPLGQPIHLFCDHFQSSSNCVKTGKSSAALSLRSFQLTGVGGVPHQSQAAELAAASQTGYQQLLGGVQINSASAPIAKHSSKHQFMWMHRLPAYRTRFQQIWTAQTGMRQRVQLF